VRLRDELWESAWLAEWRQQTKAVLVDVVEAPQRLQLSLDVGADCPLHATAAGKAIAAHLPPKLLKAALGPGKLPRFTPHTITRREQLQAELEKVRRLGYAMNEEETIEGAILVGAPVFDSTGRVWGAISVSVPTARWSNDKFHEMTAAVKRAAAAFTADLTRLGFQALNTGQNGQRSG
jgi:IclR family acetate operon transcriptional repressor